MSLKHGSSEAFYLSLQDVDTLVDFAKKQDHEGNEDNRILFLKLAIVTIVTKFQVFVESILSEFMFNIKTSNIKYNKVPIYMRLNSLKMQCQDYGLIKKLDNPEAYKKPLYKKVENYLAKLKKHYSSKSLGKEFSLKTKFPLGKTGKNDLIKLFMQFEGKNIFQNKKIDIDKIDSLFLKRHLIIHQDRSDLLTEHDVLSDQHYLKILAKHIDRYLEKKIEQYKRG